MQTQQNARIHRLGDMVALSFDDTQTVYLTPDLAKELSFQLTMYEKDCRSTHSTDSTLGSRTIRDPKPLPTLANVVEHVRKLADRFPDNVFDSERNLCLYTAGKCSNGSCGCLIGQALIAAGVPRDELAKIETTPDGDYHSIAASSLFPILQRDGLIQPYDKLTPYEDRENRDRLEWLYVVQEQQDDGQTWAEAVAYAGEYACGPASRP